MYPELASLACGLWRFPLPSNLQDWLVPACTASLTVSHLSGCRFYTHFSLPKSLESGFRLPCLNHACDASTSIMSDLFADGDRDKIRYARPRALMLTDR